MMSLWLKVQYQTCFHLEAWRRQKCYTIVPMPSASRAAQTRNKKEESTPSCWPSFQNRLLCGLYNAHIQRSTCSDHTGEFFCHDLREIFDSGTLKSFEMSRPDRQQAINKIYLSLRYLLHLSLILNEMYSHGNVLMKNLLHYCEETLHIFPVMAGLLRNFNT